MIEDDKWFRDKTLEFTEKIVQVETKIGILNENVKDTKKELSQDIQNAVTNRIDDMMTVIDGQLKTQNKILEIQGRQSEQISAIQKTLADTQNAREAIIHNTEHLKSVDKRLEDLENKARSEEQINKSQKTGMWSMIVALIGAIATVLTTVLSRIL